MGSNKSRRTLSRLSERCAVDGSSKKKNKKLYQIFRYARGHLRSRRSHETYSVRCVSISAENLRRRETPRPARHRRVFSRYTQTVVVEPARIVIIELLLLFKSVIWAFAIVFRTGRHGPDEGLGACP